MFLTFRKLPSYFIVWSKNIAFDSIRSPLIIVYCFSCVAIIVLFFATFFPSFIKLEVFSPQWLEFGLLLALCLGIILECAMGQYVVLGMKCISTLPSVLSLWTQNEFSSYFSRITRNGPKKKASSSVTCFLDGLILN